MKMTMAVIKKHFGPLGPEGCSNNGSEGGNNSPNSELMCPSISQEDQTEENG